MNSPTSIDQKRNKNRRHDDKSENETFRCHSSIFFLMNFLRLRAVQQIKEILRSIPEIRHIDEKQLAFDEKLFSLTRIEPVRAKDLTSPLGRFVISLGKCQKAKLIESEIDFDSKKNGEFRSWPIDGSDRPAVLDRDGGLRIPIEMSKFIPVAFDDLIKMFRQRTFYDSKKSSWYFDDWRKTAKWSEITEKTLNERNGKKVVVEFSSPNIAKPLHAGHLRSTLLGQFIATIHERFGHQTYRLNYLGDWGTQYGRLAVGFRQFGSLEELKKNALKHLLEIYIRANKDESFHTPAMEYFARMEAGDQDALKLWNQFRDMSIENLKEVYRLFNIHYDEYQFESQFSRKSREIIDELDRRGFCRLRDDGVREAVIPARYNSLARDAKLVVQKSDGTTLYLTRDIAALKFRLETMPIEKILYVVDSSQTEHFRHLLTACKALHLKQVENWEMDDFYIPFGRMINLQTRRGKIDLLSDVYEEAQERAHEGLNRFLIRKSGIDPDRVSKEIGKAYLILTDFSRPRRTDYIFSWEEIASKDGIAFLLLYCHARLCSLEREVQMPINWSANVNYLTDRREQMLIQQLSTFQDVLFDSYRTSEPHKLVQYLIRLVQCINRSLATNYVKDEEKHLAEARLLLYHICRLSLKEGLELLGIEALQRI